MEECLERQSRERWEERTRRREDEEDEDKPVAPFCKTVTLPREEASRWHMSFLEVSGLIPCNNTERPAKTDQLSSVLTARKRVPLYKLTIFSHNLLFSTTFGVKMAFSYPLINSGSSVTIQSPSASRTTHFPSSFATARQSLPKPCMVSSRPRPGPMTRQ